MIGAYSSNAYVVPASGTVGISTPGNTTGTGIVPPIWAEGKYVYFDAVDKKLYTADTYPSASFSLQMSNLTTSGAYIANNTMTFENGKYFVPTEDGILYMFSSIGGTLTTSIPHTGGNPKIVRWHPAASLWVCAGGSGKLSTSVDGSNWTARTATGTNNSQWLATDGTTMVLVRNGGELFTSTDAITWTSRTSSFGTSAIYRVEYSPIAGYWLASGAASKVAYCIGTNNATTGWTQITTGVGNGSSQIVVWLTYHMGRWLVSGNTSDYLWRSSSNNPSTATWSQATSTLLAGNRTGGGSNKGYIYWTANGGKFYWAR